MHRGGTFALAGIGIMAAALLSACSKASPPPPPDEVVVEATIGGQQTTIEGWSECPPNDETGRTLIQVHAGGSSDGATFSAGVDEKTGDVNWLSLIDDANGVRLETTEGDLTATRSGQSFRIDSRPGYNPRSEITVTCTS